MSRTPSCPWSFCCAKTATRFSIARNGTEALEAINRAPLALVLLDVMMPDVDGCQVCRHVRQRAGGQATKMIILSARSRGADGQKGCEAGADLSISKPFSARQLMEQVQTLIASAV